MAISTEAGAPGDFSVKASLFTGICEAGTVARVDLTSS